MENKEEEVSGGQNAEFGRDSIPEELYQPYQIEEAPDDIGLPKH